MRVRVRAREWLLHYVVLPVMIVEMKKYHSPIPFVHPSWFA